MAGKPKEKWSKDVTENSDALDLEAHVFEQHDPHKIAVSLKRSAEAVGPTEIKSLPVRDVDVDVLYQPCRPQFARQTKECIGACQGRTEEGIRPHLKVPSGDIIASMSTGGHIIALVRKRRNVVLHAIAKGYLDGPKAGPQIGMRKLWYNLSGHTGRHKFKFADTL